MAAVDFSGSPVVRTQCFHCRAWIRALVVKPEPCKLHNTVKKKKKKKASQSVNKWNKDPDSRQSGAQGLYPIVCCIPRTMRFENLSRINECVCMFLGNFNQLQITPLLGALSPSTKQPHL